jgi:hypothetical protein
MRAAGRSALGRRSGAAPRSCVPRGVSLAEAAADGCTTRIGEYRFTGDLHDYHITAAAEDVSAEVRLEATTEPWRPETGHLVFGAERQDFLAWLVAVPMGKVTATYGIGSSEHHGRCPPARGTPSRRRAGERRPCHDEDRHGRRSRRPP